MTEKASSALEELPAPDYSEEERSKIVEYLIELKADLIRDFADQFGILRSGTKSELRDRIQDRLDEGHLQYKDLVDFLDTIAPYGKQHVFLMDGPEAVIQNWRSLAYVETTLGRHKLTDYLNARLPLVLPAQLTLSSIRYLESRTLEVYAVERRDHWVREADKDESKTSEGNVEIQLRAYSHRISRGVVLFYWDLVSNTASLHISQLESGADYDKIATKFGDMIAKWLNLQTFARLELSTAIKNLNALERNGTPEARSRGAKYKTIAGRDISVQSPTPQDSIMGEPDIDNVLNRVITQGIGRIGNFYWLSASASPSHSNILERELHSVIVRDRQRINLTTPNRKEDIEYVLSRVRALSA
jgi:hypothetical protein